MSAPMRRIRSGCCARAERPHHHRSADKTEKFPPPHVRTRARD
jgi:hypothetical protein